MSDSENLVEASPAILEILCRELDWQAAALWLPEGQPKSMRCVCFWMCQDALVPELKAASFRMTFKVGRGLPGRILEEAEPEWIRDVSSDPDFPRAGFAMRDGMMSVAAFPVLFEEEVHGVMEFFARGRRERDEEVLLLMASIGNQIGAYLKRWRVEESLRVREEEHRLVLETAGEGIITISEESIITAFNQAAERIFGYQKNEVLGKSLTMLMPEEYRVRHRQGLRRHLETGVKRIPWTGVELPGLHKNGKVMALEISFGSVRGQEGSFFTGIVRDVTERKEAQRELEMLNLDLDRRVQDRTADLLAATEQMEFFNHSMAHDLQAPLRAITSFSQILLDEIGASINDTAKDHLRRITRAGAQMGQLVEGLLMLSRISSERIELNRVSLAEVISEVETLCGHLLEEREAELQVSSDLPAVMGNHFVLVQILSNLVSNAVKFVPAERKPLVTIGGRAGPEEVFLQVKDNGIGMSDEEVARVFEPFRRLHRQLYPGSGLGLAIVERAVKRLKGSIRVRSEPGVGTEIEVVLARASAAED